MESEGHEEKYRAVINGGDPEMNRSAKGGARSSLHYEGEGVLIHPPHQGVCGWHGTEERRVTSGGLAESAGYVLLQQFYEIDHQLSDAVVFNMKSIAARGHPKLVAWRQPAHRSDCPLNTTGVKRYLVTSGNSTVRLAGLQQE